MIFYLGKLPEILIENSKIFEYAFEEDESILVKISAATVIINHDLNFDIEIKGCPIVREADGLAKSSRNTYLSAEERQAALVLSKSIALGKKMVEDGERNAKTVIDAMTKCISAEPLAKIDYVSVVDALSITPIDEYKGYVLTAIAVYIGKTRLIDNFIVDIDTL